MLAPQFLIAFALAADCFAVSVSGGIRTRRPAGTAMKFALYFGAAQALMLFTGWFAGAWFSRHLHGIANAAAFGFLTLAGLRMFYEGLRGKKEHKINLDNHRVLLGLALATSIDALIVGAGLSLINLPLLSTALVVGGVAFIVSLTGVYAGDITGKKIKRYAEVAGGLILISIGTRILLNGFT